MYKIVYTLSEKHKYVLDEMWGWNRDPKNAFQFTTEAQAKAMASTWIVGCLGYDLFKCITIEEI